MHPEKVDSAWRPELSEMVVRLVRSDEQRRYQQLMRAHHYLGYLPKIGETLWYVATWREQWLALLSFSGSALKCAVRDRWIGWTLRQHYGRLKLVVNNSRFLILPDGHLFNLGSRVLSLCQRRLPGDWEEAFGHGVVLLETFVDPQRHRGTVYRAANWMYVGNTRGCRRTHGGYTATPQTPKMVFLRPLRPDACQILCGAILSPPSEQNLLHPKKVGTLPVAGKEKEEAKRTNEIKTAIPLLEAIEIAGKEVSADALLTQRELADYLVTKRKAHYHFTVKGNQPGVLEDLKLYFQDRGEAHFVEHTPPDHGRVETRKIWTTTELNDYLNFPHVAQAFVIERHVTKKKTGESTLDIAYGITSRTPQQAGSHQVLKVNRGHWAIENSCHYIIDWNYDEDRSRIRTGHGPENMTRLRRFAISVIKSKGSGSVAQKMRQLTRNVRLVFDYLRMTENSCASHSG